MKINYLNLHTIGFSASCLPHLVNTVYIIITSVKHHYLSNEDFNMYHYCRVGQRRIIAF
jgi:hypothetical protein